METIKKWAQILFCGGGAAVIRQDFPTMAFLYAITTGVSLAMGLAACWVPGRPPPGRGGAWTGRFSAGGAGCRACCSWQTPPSVRRAGCWRFVAFDTDFILLAQYVGFVIASAAGAVPWRARWRNAVTDGCIAVEGMPWLPQRKAPAAGVHDYASQGIISSPSAPTPASSCWTIS